MKNQLYNPNTMVRQTRQVHSKIIITLLIVLVFAISPSYAQSTNLCTNSMTSQLSQLLNVILSFLSWIRIIIAIMAGKLMSNDLIYGAIFGIDKILYYLRNFSRSFANFMIIGLIIYELIKGYTSNDIGSHITTIILKLIGGIILINISRFALGAVIDISSITTTAVGGLPSSYIAGGESTFKQTVDLALAKNSGQYTQVLNLRSNICDAQSIVTPQANETNNEIFDSLDKVLPRNDTLGGPLMYIGIGVLQIQDFMYNSHNPNNLTDNLFVILVRLGIIVSFTLIVILLLVINVFRLIAIRIAAAFAPILILLAITGNNSILGSWGDKLKLSYLLRAIFAPTIAVLLMGIGLIAIVIMQSFTQNKTSIERGDTYIQSTRDASHIGEEGVFDLGIGGDILGKDTGDLIKNTFTNILLIIFTLFIMYGILWAYRKYLSDGPRSKTIDNINTITNRLAGSAKILPTPRGNLSVGGIQGQTKKIRGEILGRFSETTNTQNSKISNTIRKLFNQDPVISPADYRKLTKLARTFQSTNTIIPSDYSNLVQESQTLIDKVGYNKQKISISAMQGIAPAFEQFLKKLVELQTPMNRVGSNSSTPLQGDPNDSIATIISKNYKTHKQFFTNFYNDLGGDSSKLQMDGRNYWEEPLYRK